MEVCIAAGLIWSCIFVLVVRNYLSISSYYILFLDWKIIVILWQIAIPTWNFERYSNSTNIQQIFLISGVKSFLFVGWLKCLLNLTILTTTKPMLLSYFHPIPTRLCHVIYCHGDKTYPCLVGIGLEGCLVEINISSI